MSEVEVFVQPHEQMMKGKAVTHFVLAFPMATRYVRASDYDALAAQRDEGLAREAELRAQIAELQKTGGPHFCSLPMSKNPHPEAGIPGRYLEVGAVSECIPCLVASRHSWAKTAATLQQRLAEAEKKLDPVDGDLLPAVGSKVFIHLARSDSWAEHTVVGYYAWDNHGLDKNVHRVFVRVRDSQGYLNARLLNDIRLASPGCADGEKAAAPAINLPRRKVKTEYSTAEEDAQVDAWNAALDAVQELNK